MARRPPLDQLEPRRICFIKPSALGDVIQALPVLHGMRKRWPKAQISWVLNQSFAPLLRGHPDLHSVIEFRRHSRGFSRLKSFWQLGKRLRSEHFDLTIDQQGLLRSGVMTWITRSARRVGFSHAREGATFAYTDKIAVDWREVSAVTRNWEMMKVFGCQSEPPAPQLALTDQERHWAKEQLAHLPRPLLAIHPGAQWQTKRWPPEHFATLAKQAREAFGVGIVLVGGPGESSLCEPILSTLHGNVLNLAEKTTLRQLAAVLAEADVYLSGDSGPMHLAAAVNTPVVAVFTCTSPVRAGPYGIGHRIVQTQVACAASYLKKCRSMICMNELTPTRVWPALEASLSLQTKVKVGY